MAANRKKTQSKKKAETTQFTTLYIPKSEGIAGLIDELSDLILADMPYAATIPKYGILKIALTEAIQSRTGTNRKR